MSTETLIGLVVALLIAIGYALDRLGSRTDNEAGRKRASKRAERAARTDAKVGEIHKEARDATTGDDLDVLDRAARDLGWRGGKPPSDD